MSVLGRSEIFNARFLNFQEVGASFVTPPFLEEIAAPNNTAILGPRGSGKTTLLKMLTLPAMLSWKDQKRDAFSARIDYLAIYIPSSLTWNADYRGFSGSSLEDDVSDLISVSLLRHNVLFALLGAWRDASSSELNDNSTLSRFYIAITAEREAELARDLSRRWELELPISSVGGLQQAISSRFRLLQRLIVRAAYKETSVPDLLDKYDFLSAHLLDDCSAFADFLYTNYGFKNKLALCFDEVEIAPDPIAKAIIRMPRSIDQRFLVKFSAAPYVGISAEFKGATNPTQGQDFRFVLLSSFSAKGTLEFSEALFASLSNSFGIKMSATDVLGKSLVDEDQGADGDFASRYDPAGPYQRRFQALKEADLTFEEYLTAKQINVNELSQGTENERAAQIRPTKKASY